MISFGVDKSLSSDLRIKIIPFNFRFVKSGEKLKKIKIDFVTLLFNECNVVKQILCSCSRFAKSLIGYKHHYVTISLRGGFGSPDITGIVWGAIQTVQPVLGEKVAIVYYPDMITQSVNLNLSVQTEFRIYSILTDALILVFSLPILKIARIFIQIKKGGCCVRTT